MDVANPFGWSVPTTATVAAITFGQPVFMVSNLGPDLHVSLTYSDGTTVSGDTALQAMAEGQIENVIPVVHDSVNHWYTLIGAMLQTWIVLRGQQAKGLEAVIAA